MNTILMALATFALLATTALAHATFEKAEAEQGKTWKAVLRVPHGCAGEATLKVRVQIPEGMHWVKPMPKAGWMLETVTGPYANAYVNHGSKVTEGVKEIIWSGELLDAHYDEFVFRGTMSDAFAVDSTVYVPVVQECANGAERWIEIPAEGQSAGDLRYPAPGVKIISGSHGH
jgi:uncharacterized protein YcnI